MADKKISELTELTTPDGTEELVVNDSGVSKKVQIDNLIADNGLSGNKIDGGTISNFTSTGIDDNATSTAIVINASEHVGIGPVAPATILDVSGVNEVIRITDTTTSVGDATEIGTFEVYGSDASSGGVGVRTKMATYSDSASGLAYGLKFYTSLSNAAPVVGMTIDSSQNVTIAGNLTSLGIDDNATSTAITIDASEFVGIGFTTPTAKLHIRGGGAFNHTAGLGVTSDVIVTSSEMADNNYHSIMQLVSVRRSLSTGAGANGYLGFTTIDDSNASGKFDAGRIAIVNETATSVNSKTALTFWTNDGTTNTDTATERMRIDSAGIVTMPYQPAFSAYCSNLAYAVNTDIWVDLSVEEFDIGNNLDTTTGKFTAPIAGSYMFTAALQYSSNGTAHITFGVNGALVNNGWTDFGVTKAATQSRVLNLAVGDYVQLKLYHSVAGTLTGNRSRMTGYLIG